MSTITVQEIQRDPLAFLRRVEAGESLLVLRDQHPVAEVRPVAAPNGEPRPYVLCAGQFTVPADFDEQPRGELFVPFEGA
jgi:antitoxin (DNA-binding transcriptional repressor) of toxin-antitoxin stability system